MPARRRTNRRAFTLLELVLVMVVICTALAVAAPSMTGWSRGSRLRDATDQFLAVTRFARSQAVADSRVYRVHVDAAAGRYWVTMQEGLEFINVGSSFGQVFTLSDELRIELAGIDQQAQQMEFIEFYPTGRTWPARVRISLGETDFLDAVCDTPAGEFRVISSSGGPV